MMRLRWLASLLLLTLFAVACDSGGAEEPDRQDLLYVCNQDEATVSVVDMETNELVETVDLVAKGFGTEATRASVKPHHVDADADGNWYVSLIGVNRVAKFTAENELAGTVQFESPGMVDVDETSDLLYVTHTMSIVDVPATVAAIDRNAMTLEETIDVLAPRPHGILTNPAGGAAYTASLSQNRLVVIDTETQEPTLYSPESTSGVQRFVHFASPPGGGTLWVTAQDSAKVHLFDTSDPLVPAWLASVRVGAQPWHPVITPDGSSLYVPNRAANSVTVIDAATRSAETVIEGEGLLNPHGSAVRPDGRYVYVSNNGVPGSDGTLVIIDTQTREIAKVLTLGRKPAGVGN